MKWIIWLHLLCCFTLECHAHKADDNSTKHKNTEFDLNSALSQPDYKDDIVYADIIPLPTFLSEVKNKTVTAGRNVFLACKVENLGNYKVAWVRVDTQTILTIHDSVITRNQRITLSHHDKKIWRLHLDNVHEADKGWYMCQVNTDPMRSVRGYLDVVVPPSIIDSKTSHDIIVKEGAAVNLTCEARGSPRPRIMWKREDGEPIKLDGDSLPAHNGNTLFIEAASRVHIGAYFCIASNGVPPSISKRIDLRVQFPPMIWVQNQLEYGYMGRHAVLHCSTESFPPAIHYWKRYDGTAITSGKKYKVSKEVKNYVTHITLEIFKLDQSDFTTYLCLAKNSLGESDGAIKLIERPLPAHEVEVTSSPAPLSNSPTQFQNHQTMKHLDDQHGVTYRPFLPTTGFTVNEWTPVNVENSLGQSIEEAYGNSGRVEGQSRPWCLSLLCLWIIFWTYDDYSLHLDGLKCLR